MSRGKVYDRLKKKVEDKIAKGTEEVIITTDEGKKTSLGLYPIGTKHAYVERDATIEDKLSLYKSWIKLVSRRKEKELENLINELLSLPERKLFSHERGELYFSLGLIYQEKEDYRKAINYTKEALPYSKKEAKLSGDKSSIFAIYYQLAYFYNKLHDQDPLNNDNLIKADEYHRKAYELNPNKIDLYDWVDTLINLGMTKEALDILQIFYRKDKNNPEVNLWMGQVHHMSGRHNEAKAHLHKRFLKELPVEDQVRGLLTLANCYINEDSYDLAQKLLDEAASKNIDSQDLIIAQANLNVTMLKDLPATLKKLEKIHNPNFAILLMKGRINSILGNHDKAIESFLFVKNNCLDVKYYSIVCYDLSNIYLEISDYHNALKHLEEAHPTFKTSSMFFNRAGYLNCIIGNYEKAANYFIQAKKLDPNNPIAERNACFAYIFKKNISEASESLTKYNISLVQMLGKENAVISFEVSRLKDHITRLKENDQSDEVNNFNEQLKQEIKEYCLKLGKERRFTSNVDQEFTRQPKVQNLPKVNDPTLYPLEKDNKGVLVWINMESKTIKTADPEFISRCNEQLKMSKGLVVAENRNGVKLLSDGSYELKILGKFGDLRLLGKMTSLNLTNEDEKSSGPVKVIVFDECHNHKSLDLAIRK